MKLNDAMTELFAQHTPVQILAMLELHCWDKFREHKEADELEKAVDMSRAAGKIEAAKDILSNL